MDVLSTLLESEYINAEDRRYFAEKMVDVADKMAALDHSNKDFFSSIADGFAFFTSVVVIVCASVLGVNVIKANRSRF